MSVDSQGNEVGKLFVGGLHQSTTNDSLKSYFSKFGEIEESTVMMDNRTGRSRGFGYVKFKSDDSVDWVLKQKSHVIDHKEVDPKRCNVNMKGKNRRSLKVFVGGIALEHDETVIRNFFSNYGRVTDVNLLPNQNRQRHRGFAFVGFDDEEAVKNLIRLHFFNLNGKQVEVKAMKPPNTQKLDFPFPVGNLSYFQTNGRPVRGGRGNPYNQLQTYPPLDQWISNWNGSNSTHNQPSHGWPPIGWTNSAGNTQHNAQAGAGPGPPLSNHGTVLGNWPDHSMNPTNGWMPSPWSHPVNGPGTTNRIHPITEEVSLYHQQPRKPSSSWDSLCLNSLTPGHASGHNSIDPLRNPMDSWNQSAAAAAALCQLAPPSLSTSLALGGPTGVPTSWNQGQTVSSVNNQWVGVNSAVIPSPGSNANHVVGGNNNLSGFLSESLSIPHQNGTAMAAMAAAVGLGNSPGCPPLAHWSSAGSVDPSSLKLNDSLYRNSGGCNLSNSGTPAQNPINLSHPGTIAPNGLLSGDWCAVAANNVVGTSPLIASGNNYRAPQSHLFKR